MDSMIEFRSTRISRSAALLASLGAMVGLLGAAPESPWRPVFQNPPVVKGGRVVLPISPDPAVSTLPAELEITLDDGRVIPATILHVSQAIDPGAVRRRWTDAAVPVKIEPFRGGARPSAASESFQLVLEALEGYEGSLRVGRFTIAPRWLDPAPPIRTVDDDGNSLPVLARVENPGLPDPESPFEYWRWVLLAERLHQIPPEPPGEMWNQVVAVHAADLWRAAFARLSSASRGVAAECMKKVTGTVRDGDLVIAAWLTEPSDLDPLLALLTRTDRSPADMVDPALQWAEVHADPGPILLDSGPDHLLIGILRSGVRRAVAQFLWDRRDEIAVAEQVAAGELVLVRVQSPLESAEAIALPGGWIEEHPNLAVSIDGRTSRVVGPPRFRWAAPPGVDLGPFRPVLTLGDLRASVQPIIPQDRMTVATFRRSASRWELYVEARRPPDASGAGIRSGEFIEVHLGPSDDPVSVVRIPEEGDPLFVSGQAITALEVHRRSFPDRWRARIVFPDEWLPRMPVDAVLLGVLRSHGDTGAVETAGLPVFPWRLIPSRTAIRLECWDGSRPVAP
jgi:hypothetical protein